MNIINNEIPFPFLDSSGFNPLKSSLLVVDDDPSLGKILKRYLVDTKTDVIAVSNISEAIAELEKNRAFSLILLDVHLPDVVEVDGLIKIQSTLPGCPVVMITGDSSIEKAVRFMGAGADDYLLKTDDIQNNVEKIKNYINANIQHPQDQNNFTYEKYGLVVSSHKIHSIVAKIEKLKSVNAPIMISGESGVGKEKIAQLIHKLSSRSEGPFVAVNCAAIPTTLFESELFGHKKGAFTDAKANKKGFFEICDNGTLFLDEVGEIPLELQSKLLRVIQESEIVPVGSCNPIKINTRVISATNKNLDPEKSNSHFRKDLYYRLSVFNISIPPLRERKDDIIPLVESFVREFENKYNRKIQKLPEKLKQLLVENSWPGNIRELRNAIERGVALSTDGCINIKDVFPPMNVFNSFPKKEELLVSDYLKSLPYDESEEIFQKEYLINLLNKCNHNISEMARVSRKNRMWVYRVADKLRIDLTR